MSSDTVLFRPCPNCGDVTIRYTPDFGESCDTCGREINPPTPTICGATADHGLVCQNSYGHRANGGRDNDGHYYVVMASRG